jgi:hypothetical protein
MVKEIENGATDINAGDSGQQTRLPNQDKTGSLSRWLTVVGWIGMIVFAFHASTHMVAAGDTWVAMACGRHFVNHGVNTVEPFSANSHHAGPTPEEVKTWPNWAQSLTKAVGLKTVQKWHPTGWVNQNWLTHVLFYKLATGLGSEEEPFYDALVYWKFVLYFTTVFCVYAIARVQKVTPLLAAAFASFAMFIGRSFLDVRPAGFSNLMVPALVLVFTLAHYRNVLWIWIIVPLAALWCNLHGGYIYVFIMLVPFWGVNLLCLPFKNKVDCLGVKGLIHTAAAGVVALIAVILVNPFHLTNLTHTFVISLSKHAERWRAIYEWHPAFEWSNPVGTAKPFLVLFILVWMMIIVWPIVRVWSCVTIRERYEDKKTRGRNKRQKARFMKQASGEDPDGFALPRLNLALLCVSLLTIYMAYRSRRFIPIAAVVSCPFVALMIQEIFQTARATFHFLAHQKFECPAISSLVQKAVLAVAAGIVLGFGAWTGAEYHRIYLAPWPADAQYHSQFMRMTASFVKPFEACQFIRENKLHGKMMNYWTEGGAIAFGQTPDPNTGATPLQLFMDGRAQAAYDRKTFDAWNNIWNAGQAGTRILRKQAKNQKVTAKDYKDAGVWITGQLRKRGVWAALAPQGQFDKSFSRSLDYLPSEWALVYQDGKQKLFVDRTTPQGKVLHNGIKSGRTLYPNEFIRYLNLAHFTTIYDQGPGAKKEALSYAIKACQLNPCQVAMQELWMMCQYAPSLIDSIMAFCQGHVQDFEENKAKYAGMHGLQERLGAARIACSILMKYGPGKLDTKTLEGYRGQYKLYLAELTLKHNVMRW